MPHLLCHVASVYDGHLHGPVTLTTNTERLAVELSLPILRLRSVAALDSNPTFHLRGERSSLLHHRSGSIYALLGFYLYCTTGGKEGPLKNDKML